MGDVHFLPSNSVSRPTYLLGTKYPLIGYEVPIYWVRKGWVVHFLLEIQLVPISWVPRGGPLFFFGNFSWYRVPKGVVPSDFFQISVGTRYQNGWVVHFFLQIQLVPIFGYGSVPNMLTPPLNPHALSHIRQGTE